MTDSAASSSKLVKPNEDKFKADVAAAQKALAQVSAKLDTIRNKIKDTTGKGPSADKSAELKGQLNDLRKKQADRKSGKQRFYDELRSLDEGIHRKISSVQASKAKMPFKSVEEVDSQIKQLESRVDSGQMKLVDEKRALTEISQLKKGKRSMVALGEDQNSIDADKAKITVIRGQLEDPESKALSDQYTEIQEQLNLLRGDQDSAYKSRSVLFDQRNGLQKERDDAYQKVKTIEREHYTAKDAYRVHEQAERDKQFERRRAEKDTYEKEKRQRNAERMLEAACEPAYENEILNCENLIRYFDPTYVANPSVVAEDTMAAKGQRTVDGLPEGAKVVSKAERNDEYFVGGGKKKKIQQPRVSPSKEGNYSLSIGTMDDLNKVGVQAPMNQLEVPKTVEELKKKLYYFKDNQKEKTADNMRKAEAQIAKSKSEAQKKGEKVNEGRPTNGKVRKPQPNSESTDVNGKKEVASHVTEAEKDASEPAAEDVSEVA